MANSKVDRDEHQMFAEHGTKCLITDPVADKYLDRARKEDPTQKKFTEFCGKKNGWDDFTERWH
jgi:hypothetical protein